MTGRLMLLTLAALLLTATSSAFVYDGHRWPVSVVPYYVNVDQLDGLMTPAQAVQELQDAAANWTTQATLPFRFEYAGLTSRTAWGGGTYAKPVRDTYNVIDILPADESGNSGENVYIWWNSQGRIIETGMRFRYGAYPYFPDSVPCIGGYYLEDFATHAFGHWLQLQHPPTGPSVMQPVSGAGNCDTQRTLHPDDIAGARYIYGSTAPTPDPEPPPPATTSPDGTSVPPASAILDPQGAQWTIGSPNVILRNGVQAGNGAGSEIYWKDATISVFGTDANWWQWTGSGWSLVGPVRPGSITASPDGTRVPPASQITDTLGARWTIGAPNRILRNAVQAANGYGSEMYWHASTVYVWGTDSQWWRWTGSGWSPMGVERP